MRLEVNAGGEWAIEQSDVALRLVSRHQLRTVGTDTWTTVLLRSIGLRVRVDAGRVSRTF